jgi:hypothetical protein
LVLGVDAQSHSSSNSLVFKWSNESIEYGGLSFVSVANARTLDSRIDDVIVELIRENSENVTSANHTALMEQLVYLYKPHYDCSDNTNITLEDSCEVAVSRGGNGLTITITFPLAANYGRNVTQ